jgi:hypothetical protein
VNQLLVAAGNPFGETNRTQACGRQLDHARRSHRLGRQGGQVLPLPDTFKNLREMAITGNTKVEVGRILPSLHYHATWTSQEKASEKNGFS